jgi:GNAT superfamily N-acetyltransferase
MEHDPADLLRTLGASASVWAAAGQHEVHQEWWLALSGGSNVDLNLACSRSASSAVLTEHCLQPVVDQGRPGIIMLAGPGLATAQTLVDAGWVNIGVMPLMLLTPLPGRRPESADVRALTLEEFPSVRGILVDTFGLDQSSAAVALPDSAALLSDVGVWGLSEGGRLVASVIIVVEDGLAVVWSMATRPESQGLGYGRHLLEVVLSEQLENGATGSLLNSSTAGERLYLSLGYAVVEHLQLWSRPRWVLGFA